MDMAHTFIAGRLTGNPDIKPVGEKNQVTTFRLAVNHGYRGENGEWIEKEPTYVQVQCWGRLAENTHHSFCKGMPVLVVGRLETSSWIARDEHGHEEKRSIQRINATYAGPDLNERTADVEYDRVKLVREKDAREEKERLEAERQAQNAGGASGFGAHDDGGARESGGATQDVGHSDGEGREPALAGAESGAHPPF